MTAPDKSTDKPIHLVQYMVDTFGNWLNHWRELNELRQMNTANFDRIANDLRVSPDVLEMLARQGPHAADELPRLLKSLDIDEADLARSQPLLLRDMQRVCTVCASKRQCDRDLAAGSSAVHYEEYCLNSSSIDSLSQNAKQ